MSEISEAQYQELKQWFLRLEQRHNALEAVIKGEETIDGKPGLMTVLRDIKRNLYDPDGLIFQLKEERAANTAMRETVKDALSKMKGGMWIIGVLWTLLQIVWAVATKH